MNTLQSLGLGELSKSYRLYDATATDTSAPALVIGDTDLANAVLHQSQALHIQPLALAEGSARHVASGFAEQDTLRVLAEVGVHYAGPDPLTAHRIAVLEQSTLALQTALAAESLRLGIASKINRGILYTAIAGAAGSSWSFKNLAPSMLGRGEDVEGQTIHDARRALAQTVAMANSQALPLPLSALAKQLYSSVPSDAPESSGAWRIYGEAETSSSLKALNGHQEDVLVKPTKVALVGLGAMGYGMANVLRSRDIPVVGFDAWAPSMARYTTNGGVCAASVEECAANAEVLVLMVVNAAQAKTVLIDQKAAHSLPRNAVVILMCTVAPSQVTQLSNELYAVRPDLLLVDAPVSGGTPRAASGDLTILCAGLDDSNPNAGAARFVLRAFSGNQGNDHNLIIVPGGAGKGAAVKLINQHLAGCHIISVAEALAAAASLKIPLPVFREIILSGPAWSWMMGHRGQNMIDRLIQPPTSMIDIFVKDMGIVTSEAASLSVPVPLAAQVEQLFIMGKGRGWGRDDDSSIVRLWGEEIMAPAA